MLNGVDAAQWRKNGMMEVGEGKVVGDVRGCGWCYGERCNGMIMMTINMKKKNNNNNNNNSCDGTENNGMLMIVMVVMMIIMVWKIWCGL